MFHQGGTFWVCEVGQTQCILRYWPLCHTSFTLKRVPVPGDITGSPLMINQTQ